MIFAFTERCSRDSRPRNGSMPEGIQEYSFAIASDFGVSFLLAVSHAFVWLSGRVRTEPGRATVTHAVLKIH